MRIRKIAPYCGTRWWRWSDWIGRDAYPFFRKLPDINGFSIGPILFWDGR